MPRHAPQAAEAVGEVSGGDAFRLRRECGVFGGRDFVLPNRERRNHDALLRTFEVSPFALVWRGVNSEVAAGDGHHARTVADARTQ